MGYEMLFPLVHQMDLADFIPLSEIRNEKQKQRYINLGYEGACTVTEWENNFPRIQTRFVFFALNPFSRIFYYEKEKYILIEIPFIFTIPQFYDAEKLQNSVLSQVAQARDCFEKKDWCTLLIRVKSALQLDLLKDLVLHEEPCGEIYSTFIRAYSSAEYGFSKIDCHLLERILSGKTATQKNDTEKALTNIPDSVIVYRGETEKSRPYTEAFSWTLSYEVASFFANRFPSCAPRIIQGEVIKSKIIERINRENEVLINPADVRGIRKIELK